MSVEKLSLTDSVYKKIFSMIVSCELKDGQTLQERKVAEMLGVSRTPVREAIKRLSMEGLVDAEGRLPRVKEISASEGLEIVSIRQMLEPKAAGLAAHRPEAEAILSLIADVKEIKKLEPSAATGRWELDDKIHNVIASLSGYQLLPSILSDLRIKTRMFNRNTMDNRFLPSCEEHLEILNAILAGDSEAAQSAMETHLNNTKASILEQLSNE